MTDLSSEQWKRVEELYHDLVPKGANGPTLPVDLPGEDELVVREVRALLKARTGAHALFGAAEALGSRACPAPEVSLDDQSDAGLRTGPYELISQIGAGGMGTVWLARRTDDTFERWVAVKLIKRGMDTEEILHRFRTERKVLAHLDHPNILQVFDGGATEDGRPYLVMELVQGTPIDAYCRSNKLDVPQRIELLRQACLAVHFAHQHLVVHRDLKPSNILVTDQGVLKLLDFGIAKVLHEDAVPFTIPATVESVRLLTPKYASPEQIRGEAVTTTTDVYSLGVILFELLTGAEPYELTTRSRSEYERAICGQEPRKPSTAASCGGASGAGGAFAAGDVHRLRRVLSGDLDTIVLKALQKESNRRYASTQEFADDLQRYLANEPVRARRDSLGYRAGKFLRRNRAGVAAATSVLVVLLAASGWSTTQYLEARSARIVAEQERHTAREISTFVQQLLSSIDPQFALGRDTSVLREALDRAAQRLATERFSNPKVAAELHITIGNAYHNIGENATAEFHLRQGLMLQDGLPEGEELMKARTKIKLASLLHDMSHFAEAETLLRDALHVQQRALGRECVEAAETLRMLGSLLEQTDAGDAEACFREALEIQRRTVGAESADVARTLYSLAQFLRNRSRPGEAEQLHRDALAIHQKVCGPDHPNVIPMALGLGILLRTNGQFEAAEGQMLDAVRICRKNLSSDHPQLLNVQSNLAALYQDMGRHEDAEQMYRETLDMERRKHGPWHVNVGTTANNLGTLLYKMGRLQEAEVLIGEAMEAYRETLGANHYWVSVLLNTLARISESLGDFEAADGYVSEGLRIRRAYAETRPWQLAELETIRGACLTAQGRFAEAESVLLRSLRVLGVQYGEDKPVIRETRRRLVALYEAWGRPEKATAWHSRDQSATVIP